MINAALIGYGYWGSKLYHYLKENKNFNLKYVYALSKKDCKEFTKDINNIWRNKKVTAVVVATPIDTHYSIVKEALLHQKNVLCEKPLALKIKECLELKRLSEKQKLLLLTEYTWAFSKGLKKAQQTDIGSIKAIEMDIKHLGRFLKWDVYWLLASHMLSILDMFVPLKTLKFEKVDLLKDRELIETGMILFKNKTIKGRISVSTNYIEKETKVVIYGSKGTIIYDPLAKESLRVGWYKKTTGLLAKDLLVKTKTYSYDEINNLRYTFEYFYQALKGKAETNINLAITITKILEKEGNFTKL